MDSKSSSPPSGNGMISFTQFNAEVAAVSALFSWPSLTGLTSWKSLLWVPTPTPLLLMLVMISQLRPSLLPVTFVWLYSPAATWLLLSPLSINATTPPLWQQPPMLVLAFWLISIELRLSCPIPSSANTGLSSLYDLVTPNSIRQPAWALFPALRRGFRLWEWETRRHSWASEYHPGPTSFPCSCSQKCQDLHPSKCWIISPAVPLDNLGTSQNLSLLVQTKITHQVALALACHSPLTEDP